VPQEDINISEAEGNEYSGKTNNSWINAQNCDDEYFEVEDIKGCKLNSRVCS
jgi:hypothetical protein